MQQWTWIGRGSSRSHKRRIEEELHRFERFQLADRLPAEPQPAPPLNAIIESG
jgi:uncharacterized protein